MSTWGTCTRKMPSILKGQRRAKCIDLKGDYLLFANSILRVSVFMDCGKAPLKPID